MPAEPPVAVKVWFIVLPEPFEAPLAPVWAAVQVNAAPAGAEVIFTVAVEPEQMVCVAGFGVAVGAGFTKIVLDAVD